MAYVKTNWVNNQTPLDADNMNKIENQLATNEIETGKKLTAPETAGTNGQLLSIDGEGNTVWQNAPQVKNVEIDTTLTTAGKAADAKATGDALKLRITKPSGGTENQLLAVGANGDFKYVNAPTGVTTQAAIADLAADADTATIVTTVNSLLATLRTGKIIASK